MNRAPNIVRFLELYDRIPAFKCLEGCTACCGPVPFSKSEWARIEEIRKQTNIHCPYIEDGGCSIHAVRPFMCRLFGAVENLRCPKGCGPEKLLSAGEGRVLRAFYRLLMKDDENNTRVEERETQGT